MSGARIIDGKAAAAQLRAEIAEQVRDFAARHGRPPGLQVVLVGDQPARRAYVRTKAKMAAQADKPKKQGLMARSGSTAVWSSCRRT